VCPGGPSVRWTTCLETPGGPTTVEWSCWDLLRCDGGLSVGGLAWDARFACQPASPRDAIAAGEGPVARFRKNARLLSVEENKLLVRRLVEEAVARRNLDVLDELAAGEFAEVAKRWVRPFQSAFPDFEMEIVELIAEGEKVVAHFKCSGTHRGEWLGVPATGRRFVGVDEIYIFDVRNGRLVDALGVEDNLARLRDLGIGLVIDRDG